jgi:hypothetical protein
MRDGPEIQNVSRTSCRQSLGRTDAQVGAGGSA